MPARLHSRLKTLEAQRHAQEGPHGEGLAALLTFARCYGLAEDVRPPAALADDELDAKITALIGQRGLSLVLREALEDERRRRQAALSQERRA